MRKIALRGITSCHGVKAILRTRSARRINLFPEATLDLGQITTPVRRQQGVLHVTMETAARPVPVPPTGKPDKTRWVGKIADADGCACDDDDGDLAHGSDPTSPRVGKIAATALASPHAVLLPTLRSLT